MQIIGKHITRRIQLLERHHGLNLKDPNFIDNRKYTLIKELAWNMYEQNLIKFKKRPMVEESGLIIEASCLAANPDKDYQLITEYRNLINPKIFPETEHELYNILAYLKTGNLIEEVGEKQSFFRRVEFFINYIKKEISYYSIEEILKIYNYGDGPQKLYDFTGHWYMMQVVFFRYMKGTF